LGLGFRRDDGKNKRRINRSAAAIHGAT